MTRFQPYFDRFDICNAYYAFAAECHDGQFGEAYKIFGRLHGLGFKPGCLSGVFTALEENERAIYCNAWMRHYPGTMLPKECQEWVLDTFTDEFTDQLIKEGVLDDD